MVAESVPHEAVATVFAWADAILAGDFQTMWALMGPELRLCEAQLWVMANQGHPDLADEDHDVLADELARRDSRHPLRRFLRRLGWSRVATISRRGHVSAGTSLKTDDSLAISSMSLWSLTQKRSEE
jgi:hypothetical protein